MFKGVKPDVLDTIVLLPRLVDQFNERLGNGWNERCSTNEYNIRMHW